MDYYFKELPKKKNSSVKTLLKINLLLLLLIFIFGVWGLFFYNPPKEKSNSLAAENTELKIRLFELEHELNEAEKLIAELEKNVEETHSFSDESGSDDMSMSTILR